MTSKPQSFYKRPLPSHLIAFSSVEGRSIFQQSVNDGTMNAFFPLIEQFSTQQEPAYCGLSTLSQVLNALGVDPMRRWRGPWRWYDEELLDCCVPLDVVKKQGISMEEFACLAKCNHVKCTVIRPKSFLSDNLQQQQQTQQIEQQQQQQQQQQNCTLFDEELNEFRNRIIESMTHCDKVNFVVVSFDRSVLGQTGSGHFSPIGGYNRSKDMVLVLDSARFKYPPFWVDCKLLFQSMKSIDKMTGKSRGYFILENYSKEKSKNTLYFCKIQPSYSWSNIVHSLKKLSSQLNSSSLRTEEELIELFVETMEGDVNDIIQPFTSFMSNEEYMVEYREYLNKLFFQIYQTHIYKLIYEYYSASKEVNNDKYVEFINNLQPSNDSTSSCSCSAANSKCSLTVLTVLSQVQLKCILLTILFYGIPEEYLCTQSTESNQATGVLLKKLRELKCSYCLDEVKRIQLQIQAVTNCVEKNS